MSQLDTLSGKLLCRRSSHGHAGYSSIIFNTGGIPCNQVCGRITAYQLGSTQAFQRGVHIDSGDAYADGISIVHGSPRQHIWTFTAGRAEITAVDFDTICPCSINSTNGVSIPTFVGNIYFCDTGNVTYNGQNVLYLDDPLWDGQGCGPSSNCCSFNSPPWFNVQLSDATTDNIEVLFGTDNIQTIADTPLELLVIYIR